MNNTVFHRATANGRVIQKANEEFVSYSSDNTRTTLFSELPMEFLQPS